MKNYKVVSLIDNFNDLEEKVTHNKNDVFYCTKERYEFLKENKAVELIAIEVNEEVTKEEIKELKGKEEAEVIVEKEFEEKPKKKNNKKK